MRRILMLTQDYFQSIYRFMVMRYDDLDADSFFRRQP